MGKSAIILGATGLTGGLLLKALIKDSRYDAIILFGRKTCGIQHDKITEYLVDLFELEHYKNEFKADEVFCCIGTTKSKTPDKDTYYKIDYGIPVTVAKLCSQNKINTLAVISALGADKASKVFYNATKGKMEDAVLEYDIKNCYILQPSLISGDRNEMRFGELVAKKVMSLVNSLLFGKLKKYRSIAPEEIVDCMIWLSNNEYNLNRIPSDVIKELAYQS
ncbi:NAD-dependent epimerase/dehydratase family protein [Changchengzhania lutea]|uniref:NAD-dependent epimerase/dehydratase family protein n=1 Tax=Changchengzhania lutea TaxID=2049305 RepID=UPI00115E2694|nr:NAD-dependent epimerase/dehydratase family protein [Changchengzhania lutea]